MIPLAAGIAALYLASKYQESQSGMKYNVGTPEVDTTGLNSGVSGQQGNLYGQLGADTGLIRQRALGQGPSLAAQQAASDRQTALSAAQSQAASARGTSVGLAQRMAAQGQASALQGYGRNAAMGRAQEMLGSQGQLTQADTGMGQYLNAARGQELGIEQMNMQGRELAQNLQFQKAQYNAEKKAQAAAGFTGGISAIAGGLSDINAKQDIQPTNPYANDAFGGYRPDFNGTPVQPAPMYKPQPGMLAGLLSCEESKTNIIPMGTPAPSMPASAERAPASGQLAPIIGGVLPQRPVTTAPIATSDSLGGSGGDFGIGDWLAGNSASAPVYTDVTAPNPNASSLAGWDWPSARAGEISAVKDKHGNYRAETAPGVTEVNRNIVPDQEDELISQATQDYLNWRKDYESRQAPETPENQAQIDAQIAQRQGRMGQQPIQQLTTAQRAMAAAEAGRMNATPGINAYEFDPQANLQRRNAPPDPWAPLGESPNLSDKDSKQLVEKVSHRFDDVKPYSYEYKPEIASTLAERMAAKTGGNPAIAEAEYHKPRIGVMAQDMQEAMPSTVEKSDMGLAINRDKALAFALAANAGLNERVKKLEEQRRG
jgi:hypothetical protein